MQFFLHLIKIPKEATANFERFFTLKDPEKIGHKVLEVCTDPWCIKKG
jgi:hypothetical protein